MASYKLLPKGISDFRRIRLENYYFVDKSMFIPRLENAGSFLFFCRPRRFGKSLMLSMLDNYYDCKKADDFDRLFSGLWIHEHPTQERASFQLIRLDFSQVTGKLEELKTNLDLYCDVILDAFAKKYEDQYFDGFAEEVSKDHTAYGKLIYIFSAAKQYGHKLYLILDEYDNFTNTVLAQHGEAVYRTLTHADGFYRDLFKLFKGNFDRIMMMGVSPVTMDDLTSGYNIATNITTDYFFNMFLGFSETDVRQMIEYYRSEGAITMDTEDLVRQMKPWYDNYCFSQRSLTTDPKMFNSNMVTYFVSYVIIHGMAPESMVDPNARTDYNKLNQLVRLDKIDPYRKSVLFAIAQDGYIYSKVKDYFPAIDLIKEENFISLLYYYGMLTITGMYRGQQILSIPNNNVRIQYYNYILEDYQRTKGLDAFRLTDAFTVAAYDGEWKPLLSYIAESYKENSAIRSGIEGERNIQGFFLAYLNMYDGYLTAPEVEVNHGYCDFFLLPDTIRQPDILHSYIIELKYLKTDASDTEAEQQWLDAVNQIKDYGQGKKVQLMASTTKLHLVILQFKGIDLIRMGEI